jgi:hypothetical protein
MSFQDKIKEMQEWQKNKKSGFFPLPKDTQCMDPAHTPPTHICIPQGQGYRHVCPTCGKVTTIIPPQIRL